MAVLVSASMNAQIDLEHKYEQQGIYTTVQLANSGFKYVLFDNAGSSAQIKLYNVNHSLWKTIDVPNAPTNYWVGEVKYISESLFDLDNKIECLVVYRHQSADSEHIKIINENGTVIKDLPNRQLARIVSTAPNTFKLLVNDYSPYPNNGAEVYSLPGTTTNLGVSDNEAQLTGFAYPNPSSQFITLPYKLNGANKGVLNVYNLNGQIIETFNIDSVFDTILLDVSNYAAGMYRYGVFVNGMETTSSFLKQ